MGSSTAKSATGSAFKPAAELARASNVRFPNESSEYRRAREALLAEEIELRRHIERVAERRRALPPGGEVKKKYAFKGEGGPASFADLFGDKNTLVVYSFMFGPQRERPCPMCTSLLSAWDGEVPDIRQRSPWWRGHPSSGWLRSSASVAGAICRSIRMSPSSSAATITD
jgi:hypothetical protein